ncbi:carboxylesterase/lipase family protein [Lichenicoccus sp.]|uniref:carboxylesterase/lipase family protein n=1 Tax=Lichenicoccus sp. TaxID=2781899 RepID=UPI003D1305C2
MTSSDGCSRRRFLGGAAAGVGLLATDARASRALVEPGQQVATGDGGVLVHAPCGRIRGQAVDGVARYLGIPYGQVPGRFLPPQAAQHFSGVFEADRFGPMAVQRVGHTQDVASEQCLNLNVFAPAGTPATGLPVMVWIHGGSNVAGAASEPIYDGASFARSGVICVTLDYRLGVLGFLELGVPLGTRYAGSGNNAIRDQRLALRWVRQNIAAFGGDPRRVTLAGESAGAKDVAALAASPSARALFSRVILESGGGRTVLSMPAAREITTEYLRLLSLPPHKVTALPHLDLDRLIEAQHELVLDPPHNFPLRPVVDGVLLPAMPEDAIRAGCMQSRPLLLGTNRDESRLFLGHDAATQPLQARNLANLQPDAFERILQHYDASITPPDPAELRWRALTAEEYWIPSLRVAEAQCHAGGAVWMYRFDRAAQDGVFTGRAAHASELAYVWSNPGDGNLAPLDAGFDAELAATMHAAWVAFIVGGAPAAAGLPDWPRYEIPQRRTMILNVTSAVQDDPDALERRLWAGALGAT